MFSSSASYRSKREVTVRVRLSTGEELVGAVYLKVDERLIDMVNDERSFIPIKRSDSDTIIVAKSSIASLLEVDASAFEAAQAEKGSQTSTENDDQGDKSDADSTEDTDPCEASDGHNETNGDTEGDGGERTDEAAAQDAADADASEADASDDSAAKGGEPDAEEGAAPEPDPSAANEERRRNERYHVLKIKPSASIEEIRAAYKARIKQVHPDTFAGEGVSEEKKMQAVKATQLVNRAYKAIMAEREKESADQLAPDIEEADSPAEAKSA